MAAQGRDQAVFQALAQTLGYRNNQQPFVILTQRLSLKRLLKLSAPEREALLGSFGLVPHWATDTKIARQTYNARTETVASKPSFRDAWKKAHHCIIPADAIYEPDWRSGKAVPTRISRSDGQPMGIAGLWSWWKSPKGEVLHSFTMLTINADQHPLMNQFHKPNDEKRMVVVLPEHRYDDWLHADAQQSAASCTVCSGLATNPVLAHHLGHLERDHDVCGRPVRAVQLPGPLRQGTF